jgi:poly-gamma-glutamate synthesis protein (capsule biosynthesis protein)
MLARTIGERIERDGSGVVFAGVADQLADADVTVANLECAISERGEPASKGYTFRAPPAGASALAEAGIDLVSLANNHAVDYGRAALVDTLTYLDAEGVAAVGAGRDLEAARAPALMTVNGLRIAFLSYAGRMIERSGWRTTDGEATATEAGIAIARPDDVAADVRSARERADVVVVLMHAGIEGSATPAPVQQEIARAALDAGAALVFGHHPHVLQGTWHDDGRLVAWSLGNFVFDGFNSSYGGRATDSAILEVALTPSGVESFDWLPVVVVDGLPRPASEAQAERIGGQIGATQAP